MEFAFGRLSGTHWIFANGQLLGPVIRNQPFLHVEKIGFKPTPNFEFGMGISVVFGGPGLPVTWGNFSRSFKVLDNSTALAGTSLDPGDRRATADFSYRIPRLCDWLTFYADSLVEDEVSPLGSSRPALRAGLHLPKLPKVPKLDLRLEAVYTDAPNTVVLGNYYINGRYRSGYTNDGRILGNWVGRAGKGGLAWATYWFSPRSTLQFQYRRQHVSGEFLRGGGLHDLAVKGEIYTNRNWSFQASVQYENWRFPLLAATAKSNLAASLQVSFYPHWKTPK
jgi:hypothetical protein